MTVIADSLGVPRAHMDTFHRWSVAFIVQLGGVSDRETRLEASAASSSSSAISSTASRKSGSTPRPISSPHSDLVHADLAEEGDPRESHFPDSGRFDVARENARSHLAFGAGIHTCIAAPLARKEMQVAFPILLERLKNPRFAKGLNSFRYNPNILLRGVLELHIEFDR